VICPDLPPWYDVSRGILTKTSSSNSAARYVESCIYLVSNYTIDIPKNEKNFTTIDTLFGGSSAESLISTWSTEKSQN